MINKLKQYKKVKNQFSSKKDLKNFIKNIKNKQEKINHETYFYFYEKYPINIYYQNIDYMTCKLHVISSELITIKNKLRISYDHRNDIKNSPISIERYNHYYLFDKFYILNLWESFWGQKQVYWIYDKEKNKVWSVVLVNESKKKNNHNIINSLELTGLFFKCYQKYLDNFLDFFEIDKNKNDVLKRLDYCIDLKWIEVFQLLEYIKPIYKKTKNVDWLTWLDKKTLMTDYTSDIKYWRKETFKNFLWSLNDLKIYDKVLDLLQPELIKRKVNWKNPYKDYIDSGFPITRLELKKKSSSFTKIKDHSINFMLENIEWMFFDYLKKYFEINLSLFVWHQVNNLNWKKIFLAKEKKEKSLDRCEKMALANLRSIENISWKKAVYKFLLDNFPEIQKISKLSLLDEFESLDLVWEIFYS